MNLNSSALVVWIIVLNTVIAAAYTVLMWLKDRSTNAPQRGGIIILCPVVGMLCLLTSFLVDKVLSQKAVDYENLSIDKTRKQFLQPVDREREMEVLPLEEILAVSTVGEKRRAMLNMLKQDAGKNLALIRKAAEDEDSETSHYAAAALTDMLGRFSAELNALQIAYDKDRSSLRANRELLDAVRRVLDGGGLMKVEESRYQYMVISLIQNLEKDHPDEMTPADYTAMVRALYSVGRPQEAEKWAELSLERQPEAEGSYLNVMFIKYALGKGAEFDAALKRLTGSSIALSETGLRIVRFWLAK